MKRQKRKYHFIYRIINIINNTFYIGMHSTYNINDGYFGSGKRLKHSIAKYGKENHKIEILEHYFNRTDLANREKELMTCDELKNPLCLNLKEGGEGGWDHVNSDSTLQRIKGFRGQAAMKKLKATNEEWANKVFVKRSDSLRKQFTNGIRTSIFSNPEFQVEMTDRARSDAAKIKRKETFIKNKHMQGEKNSMYGKCWIFKKSLKENKVINKCELENYLAMGWEKGRIFTKWEPLKSEHDTILIVKLSKREILIESILKSKIDVTLKGWPKMMAEECGVSRSYLKKTIKNFLPEFYKKCLIETNMSRIKN